MHKPQKHHYFIFSILLLLLVFAAGCAISTSSEPSTVDEATFQPNQAQLQERQQTTTEASQQQTDVPVQTEEPTEPETEPAPADTATDAATTNDTNTDTNTDTAPGPQQTQEPTEPEATPPTFADAPVVIDRVWFIFNDIGDETASLQTWFFLTNNTSQPYSDDDADGIGLSLPAEATEVSVGDGYSVTETDGTPLIRSNQPLPANAAATSLIVNYQLPSASLDEISLTLAYPVVEFIVYTPQALRPQREVPGYEFVDIRLIRGLGEFLRFQQTNIDAETPINFALQESTEIRFPEGTETTTVAVTVANQTSGGTVPDGLEVTAVSIQIGDQNTTTQLFEETQTNTADGVTFSNVPYVENGFIEFQVAYNDVTFFSRLDGLEITADDTNTSVLPIYETTNDSSVLELESVWYIGDAVTGEGVADFFNYYFFSNTSDRVYIGDDSDGGDILRIPLPDNTTGARIPADLGSDVRTERDEDGNYFLIDNRVIFPEQRQVSPVEFLTDYDGDETFTHELPFAAQEVIVYTAQNRFLAFEGEGFAPQGVTEIQQFGNYEGYLLDNVAAGQTITFTLRDTDETPTFAPNTDTSGGNTNPANTTESVEEDDESFLVENRLLILGLGVLIVLAGGGYMLYDLQKERIRANMSAAAGGASATSTAPMDDEQKELLEAIAKLDMAFENGEIDEASYREQRKDLKDRLMDLM